MLILILISVICWLISMLMTLSSYSSTNQNINFWASSKEYLTKFPQYIIISLLTMILLVIIANMGLLSYVTQTALGFDNLKQYLPEDTYVDVTYRIDVIDWSNINSLTLAFNVTIQRNSEDAYVLSYMNEVPELNCVTIV